MKEYDFAIIGSGIAGLSFALKAAKHGSVVVITKRKGADTNTAWAQGGIACVTSDEDSFELHVRDTLEAGAGLCDEAVVRTIVTEGPERLQDLAELSGWFLVIMSSIWPKRAVTRSGACCTCETQPDRKSRRDCCTYSRSNRMLNFGKITWRWI